MKKLLFLIVLFTTTAYSQSWNIQQGVYSKPDGLFPTKQFIAPTDTVTYKTGIRLVNNELMVGTGSYFKKITAGVGQLYALSDVSITSPADGQMLKYDFATSKWVNFSPTFLTSFTDGYATYDPRYLRLIGGTITQPAASASAGNTGTANTTPMTINGGAGGDANGTGFAQGGKAGDYNYNGGTGGATPNGTSGKAGKGSSYFVQAGDGGIGAVNGGDAGDVEIRGGGGGFGATNSGRAGYAALKGGNAFVTSSQNGAPVYLTGGIKGSGGSKDGDILLAYSPSGVRRGKVGVGIGIPAYDVDVSGDVNVTGGYYVNGVPLSFSSYVPITRTINGLALSANQTFATGTSGTDFGISSSGTTHTFNIPDASASNRGLVTTAAQTFAGDKTFTGLVTAPTYVSGSDVVVRPTGSGTIQLQGLWVNGNVTQFGGTTYGGINSGLLSFGGGVFTMSTYGSTYNIRIDAPTTLIGNDLLVSGNEVISHAGDTYVRTESTTGGHYSFGTGKSSAGVNSFYIYDNNNTAVRLSIKSDGSVEAPGSISSSASFVAAKTDFELNGAIVLDYATGELNINKNDSYSAINFWSSSTNQIGYLTATETHLNTSNVNIGDLAGANEGFKLNISANGYVNIGNDNAGIWNTGNYGYTFTIGTNNEIYADNTFVIGQGNYNSGTGSEGKSSVYIFGEGNSNTGNSSGYLIGRNLTAQDDHASRSFESLGIAAILIGSNFNASADDAYYTDGSDHWANFIKIGTANTDNLVITKDKAAFTTRNIEITNSAGLSTGIVVYDDGGSRWRISVVGGMIDVSPY